MTGVQTCALPICAELGLILPKGSAKGIAARDDNTRSNIPLNVETKIQSLISLKSKTGFVLDNSETMIFGAVGILSGNIKRTLTDMAVFEEDENGGWWLNNYGSSTSTTINKTGYILSSGMEKLITKQTSWKLEFNYINLGSINFNYSGVYDDISTANMKQKVKIKDISTTLGFSYKF